MTILIRSLRVPGEAPLILRGCEDGCIEKQINPLPTKKPPLILIKERLS